MNEIIDLFFDFCKLIHSKISLAFNWIFTLNKLTFLTAIFSAYAAFMSYQVSEKATLLSLRLANDQTLQQKPQVALIGGVVTQTMINVDKNEYEYLVEIKIKNPSLRPAIDFGFSILLPTQPFDQHLEFTRGQIDKDIEFTLQKRFINSGSLKFDVNDIGYLSFAYIDKYPVYSNLNQLKEENIDFKLQEKCAEIKIQTVQLARSELPNKWIILFENYLIPSPENLTGSAGATKVFNSAMGNNETSSLCRNKIYGKL